MSTFLQQLINGVSLGAIYSLIALGYTMVYGVLKLINFAHGDVYMVGAFMGYYIANGIGIRGAQADGLSGEGLDRSRITWRRNAGAISDYGAGRDAACHGRSVRLSVSSSNDFAYRPVRKYSRLTALITAIGVSLLLENGGQVVFGAEPKFFPGALPKRNIELFGGASINTR